VAVDSTPFLSNSATIEVANAANLRPIQCAVLSIKLHHHQPLDRQFDVESLSLSDREELKICKNRVTLSFSAKTTPFNVLQIAMSIDAESGCSEITTKGR